MNVLGISCWYHDSAACLVREGEIIAAAQEERFSRVKHDDSFPFKALAYCLEEGGINASELDAVVFYEKPFLKFDRLLENYFAFAPRGFSSFRRAMPLWLGDKLFQKSKIITLLKQVNNEVAWENKLKFSEHHLSHSASAFFPSPFEKAVVLSIDGVGEWVTTSISIGVGNKLERLKEIKYPHSLGLLYSAFTQYCGFKVNSGEYKLMGLAPYGKPIYAEMIKDHIVSIESDGSFRLNMKYFNFATGLTMTSPAFHSLFGGEARTPEGDIEQKFMDIASSIQKVTEEILLSMAKYAQKLTGASNLCLAGGVALNCVANGVLHNSNLFKSIWIQPAAGDAGGALGAALAYTFLTEDINRFVKKDSDSMKGGYLGPAFSSEDAANELMTHGAIFKRMPESDLIQFIASKLGSGAAVGWMQGRMEFGPRSLGGRSILADPRSTTAQRDLNLKIKYRESFRPFAPSILCEEVEQWFDYKGESPYMLLVQPVKDIHLIDEVGENQAGLSKVNQVRSKIPAVTHVDNSARIQTVSAKNSPKFYALIEEFFRQTGCPLLVNTSFNVRGEPIVCSPGDAFRCFMGTELDILVIEDLVLLKSEQAPNLIRDYKANYEMD